MYAYVVEEHSQRTAELVANYSRRFYESRRSTPFAVFVWRTANPEKGKLEYRGFRCQSFSVILQNSEKVWDEMHQWQSKIKGPSLKFKNQ
jgi:hypothetical protein